MFELIKHLFYFNMETIYLILVIFLMNFNNIECYIVGVGRADCTGPPVGKFKELQKKKK